MQIGHVTFPVTELYVSNALYFFKKLWTPRIAAQSLGKFVGRKLPEPRIDLFFSGSTSPTIKEAGRVQLLDPGREPLLIVGSAEYFIEENPSNYARMIVERSDVFFDLIFE